MRGWRDNHRRFAERHNDVVVVEWGYFARVNRPREGIFNYWQLSPGRLNTLPDGEFPPDRFEATGFKLLDRDPRPDGYVLLCGQVAEDAAVQDVDYPAWMRKQWDYWKSKGERVLFRPHPKAIRPALRVNKPDIHTGELSDALDGAKFVVCYNSNVGHDALLAGVPVVCDPVAPYYELSGEVCPSREARLRYFSRAAYGQWKLSEFEAGVIETLKRMGYGDRI